MTDQHRAAEFQAALNLLLDRFGIAEMKAILQEKKLGDALLIEPVITLVMKPETSYDISETLEQDTD